jgi:Fe-S cluster biogenesis protein NfuA
MNPTLNIDLLNRLEIFIRDKIAPGVLAHGGMVDIKSFEDGKLTLALSGSCTTCSMDTMTKEGIAEFVMNEFPELDDCEVIDIETTQEDTAKLSL